MAIVERYLDYCVRGMQESDISQVLEIDREAFPTQWPRPDYASFKRELRNHLACYYVASRPAAPASGPEVVPVAEKRPVWHRVLRFLGRGRQAPAGVEYTAPGSIIGIAGFWLMVGEAHIITIATRKEYKGRGIGERLLIEIIEGAVKANARIVTLEVRVSNTVAQALYDKYGFTKEGVRRNYYLDNNEDAFIMTINQLEDLTFKEKYQNMKSAYLQKYGFQESK